VVRSASLRIPLYSERHIEFLGRAVTALSRPHGHDAGSQKACVLESSSSRFLAFGARAAFDELATFNGI